MALAVEIWRWIRILGHGPVSRYCVATPLPATGPLRRRCSGARRPPSQWATGGRRTGYLYRDRSALPFAPAPRTGQRRSFEEEADGRFALAAMGKMLRAEAPGSVRDRALYYGSAAMWTRLGRPAAQRQDRGVRLCAPTWRALLPAPVASP